MVLVLESGTQILIRLYLRLKITALRLLFLTYFYLRFVILLSKINEPINRL